MRDKRVLKNASWLIGCKIAQAILGLVVSMLTARYLGPSGYGLISYAASVVAFMAPIMQLGMNATLVQELVNAPDREGEILGTTHVMTLISGLACVVGAISFAALVNRGEKETILVCALYSLVLLAQSVDMIQYWFQAKLRSKYTAITALAAYLIVSAYKLALLAMGSSVYWFAVSQALDYCMIAVVLHGLYRRQGGAPFCFSWTLAKAMLSRSHPYILSGLMVTVFAQTDRIMLKLMLDEAAVGCYSAAVTCAGMSSFVFSAVIDSVRPSVLEGRKESVELFERRIKRLYGFVIYLALAQSVVIAVLARPIVLILYGQAYAQTIPALRIVVWYTTFSYLGGAKDVWILAEGKQRYLWLLNLAGAAANVLLNLALIPIWGLNGAAVASLITQMVTNVGVGFLIKPLRRNNILIVKSLNPVLLLESVKDLGRK